MRMRRKKSSDSILNDAKIYKYVDQKTIVAILQENKTEFIPYGKSIQINIAEKPVLLNPGEYLIITPKNIYITKEIYV